MNNFVISNLEQIVLLLGLLILSATFSGCETALFSLKTHDLNRIRKSSHWVDSLILSLYKELPELLLTILLGNMIVNILYFAVATLFVDAINKKYGALGSVVFGVISFCSVLIAGEIAPKSVASVLRVWFARVVIVPVYYIHRLVVPIRVVLRSLLTFFERMINLSPRVKGHAKEIRALLELERNRGTITAHEAELLESVIKLPDIKVGEVMTPRVDVYSVAEDSTIAEVISLARECGHNKIPVRSTLDDEYIAWVDARDLFFACAGKCRIEDYYREFHNITVYDRCDAVLDHFVNNADRIGLVLDERGSGAGILVVSDLLAELFGDYGDEESPPENWISKSREQEYILDGRVSVRDWAGLYNVEVDSLRSNTIGGLITDLLGRSAVPGDTVIYAGVVFKVIATHKRRIQRVTVKIAEPEEEQ